MVTELSGVSGFVGRRDISDLERKEEIFLMLLLVFSNFH